MTENITLIQAQELFTKLKQLAGTDNTEELKALYEDMTSKGLDFEFHSANEVNFEDEPGNQHTELIQSNKLLIGGHVVNEWETTFYGYWGSGGTGWWIDKAESDLEFEIETLFEALEIYLETPDVPKLEIEDEDEE
jgi:hypothetical protein